MLLQTFKTVFADSFGKESYFVNPEIGLDIFRERNIFFAGSLLAYFTVKMQMPVFVCFFITIVFAEFVFCGCIFLNAVNNSFFFKGFQGSVDGDSVSIIKMIFYFRKG